MNKKDVINTILEGRTIPFNSQLVDIVGNINNALFLQQCVYWGERSKSTAGWYYKTKPDMKKETGLSRFQQDTAVKTLVELGIIKTENSGMPRVRYIKVIFPVLTEILKTYKTKNPTPAYYKHQKTATITDDYCYE